MKRSLSLILMLSMLLVVSIFGCTPVSDSSESDRVSQSADFGSTQVSNSSESEWVSQSEDFDSQSQESTSVTLFEDEEYGDVIEFYNCVLLKNFIVGSKDMIGKDMVYLDIDGIVDPDYEGAPWEYYQSRSFNYSGVKDGKFINPTVLIEYEFYDVELGVVTPEEPLEGERYFSYALIVRSKPFDYSGGEFTFERYQAIDQYGRNCIVINVLDGETVACEMIYRTDLDDIPLSYFEDLFNNNKCVIEC